MEKSEVPNDDVEGVPKAGVEEGVLNKEGVEDGVVNKDGVEDGVLNKEGVVDGVANGEEDAGAPNIVVAEHGGEWAET